MIVYADNAATTKPYDEVINAMVKSMMDCYGNPSSEHHIGCRAAEEVSSARSHVAKCIGAKNGNIIFTSGATEANTMAITSVVKNNLRKNRIHIITTPFEHDSVLNTIKAMCDEYNVEVSYLNVGRDGIVDPDEVQNLITCNTVLVSVMAVNNEIGTIQPIKEIGSICKAHGIIFHCDATQAVGHIPVDVEDMCIDLLTLSAHKFHGPKGIGALYASRAVGNLFNVIYGGHQERGLRPGTENVPGIVGMGTAIDMSVRHMGENMTHVKNMRDLLLSKLLEIDGSHLNGSLQNRVAGNINITFDNVEGESLLLLMGSSGVCASAGSACSTGELRPSHVLTAIGLDRLRAMNSIRISLGEDITEEQVCHLANTVKSGVEYLRDVLKK